MRELSPRGVTAYPEPHRDKMTHTQNPHLNTEGGHEPATSVSVPSESFTANAGGFQSPPLRAPAASAMSVTDPKAGSTRGRGESGGEGKSTTPTAFTMAAQQAAQELPKTPRPTPRLGDALGWDPGSMIL